MAYDRIQRVTWSDIVMAQEHSDDFTFEAAKIAGPASLAARPAVYKVTIKKTGDAAADETIVIGGTTFTAKASPSTASGTTEFSTAATAAEVAAIVQAKGLTNYTVTVAEAVITYTQTTAGTGAAVTIGNGTCENITASVETKQAYTPANSADPRYEIEPGEPVYLVSTDSDGIKTVAPINNTTTANISAFCGFIRERHSIAKGETDTDVVLVTNGCRLDPNMLPAYDQFGNAISWNYASGSIREKAEGKGFRFGKNN